MAIMGVACLLVVGAACSCGALCAACRGTGWRGGMMRPPVHIQLKHAGNHHNGLRPAAVLEHGEAERFGAVDKDAAPQVLFVLDHPMALAVPADEEEG
jgi:hypothetical protein